MKPMMPVALLLGAAMALGLWMGWQFLRRANSNPIHIGFHLLLGVGAMEAVVMLIRSTPDANLAAWGKPAALVLALAVISGFATSVVARRWSHRSGGLVLAIHAVLAWVGFVMYLLWVFNL